MKSYFKVKKNNIGFSKSATRDFQNSPPFERLACFYVTVTGDFQRFQYFNTETSFLTMKRFSQKVFLVKNNKIENALFPYKTALSQANLSQIEW